MADDKDKNNVGRKPEHPEGPTRQVSVTMPTAMVDQIDRKVGKRNRSKAIVEAVRKWVKP